MGVIDAPNYQYPEDIPAVSGDLGTVSLVVRRDTPASNVNLDGDYATLCVDRYGRLRISPIPPGIPGDVDPGSHWQVTVAALANVVATVTKASPGANKMLVVSSMTATFSATAAPAASVKLITILSGAVLWQGRLGIDAKAGASYQLILQDEVVCPANTACTFAFESAGGLTTFQTISATGYVVSV